MEMKETDDLLSAKPTSIAPQTPLETVSITSTSNITMCDAKSNLLTISEPSYEIVNRESESKFESLHVVADPYAIFNELFDLQDECPSLSPIQELLKNRYRNTANRVLHLDA